MKIKKEDLGLIIKMVIMISILVSAILFFAKYSSASTITGTTSTTIQTQIVEEEGIEEEGTGEIESAIDTLEEWRVKLLDAVESEVFTAISSALGTIISLLVSIGLLVKTLKKAKNEYVLTGNITTDTVKELKNNVNTIHDSYNEVVESVKNESENVRQASVKLSDDIKAFNKEVGAKLNEATTTIDKSNVILESAVKIINSQKQEIVDLKTILKLMIDNNPTYVKSGVSDKANEILNREE